MSYSIKHTYAGNKYYSCNKNKKTKCKAKLIVRTDGKVIAKNEHTCTSVTTTNQTADVRNEMTKYIETECVKDLSVLPTTLWETALHAMNTKYGNRPIITVNKQYAINHIYYTRRGIHGGNDYYAIESTPMCNISEHDERKFLLFNIYYSYNNLPKRLIAFGHPDLTRLLNYPGLSLFIDGTFKVTPPAFYQCLIIMLYDPSVDLYIPVLYILIDSKDELSYNNALHWVKVQCRLNIKPQTITCDFEKGLIKAIQKQFPNTTILGCLFHFKQAIRRKLLALRIPTTQVNKAMEFGKIDLLTILPPDEIITYGIPYLRSIIDENDNVHKWNLFWQYFYRTWITNFPIKLWDINHAITQEISIVNRTNNPLEVYNRMFASQFPAVKPNLILFVKVCKTESIKYVNLISQIKQGIAKPPPHNFVIYPTIPPDYIEFKIAIDQDKH